jgi:hypothetical protein
LIVSYHTRYLHLASCILHFASCISYDTYIRYVQYDTTSRTLTCCLLLTEKHRRQIEIRLIHSIRFTSFRTQLSRANETFPHVFQKLGGGFLRPHFSLFSATLRDSFNSIGKRFRGDSFSRCVLLFTSHITNNTRLQKVVTDVLLIIKY